jgi:hypothetical protein
MSYKQLHIVILFLLTQKLGLKRVSKTSAINANYKRLTDLCTVSRKSNKNLGNHQQLLYWTF